MKLMSQIKCILIFMALVAVMNVALYIYSIEIADTSLDSTNVGHYSLNNISQLSMHLFATSNVTGLRNIQGISMNAQKLKLNHAIFFSQSITYLLPKSCTKWRGLVYGILSGGKHSDVRRNSIRDTWCNKAQCLFLLAGDFSEIRDEFDANEDILWLNMPEVYFAERTVLPYKSGAFFHAIQESMPNIKYAVKTDDDSYIDRVGLEFLIQRELPDYWGFMKVGVRPTRSRTSRMAKWVVPKSLYPKDVYPVYASGAGYVLSKRFLTCITQEIKHLTFMPMEDVMTGIFAEICNVKPTFGNKFVDTGRSRENKLAVIRHYTKTRTDMIKFHTHNTLMRREVSSTRHEMLENALKMREPKIEGIEKPHLRSSNLP